MRLLLPIYLIETRDIVTEHVVSQEGIEVAAAGDLVSQCAKCKGVVYNWTQRRGWHTDGLETSDSTIAFREHAELCRWLLPDLFAHEWFRFTSRTRGQA